MFRVIDEGAALAFMVAYNVKKAMVEDSERDYKLGDGNDSLSLFQDQSLPNSRSANLVSSALPVP